MLVGHAVGLAALFSHACPGESFQGLSQAVTLYFEWIGIFMSRSTAPSAYRPDFVRRQHWFDRLIEEFDASLQVLSGASHAARANPAGLLEPQEMNVLSLEEQRHAAGLMRINQVGEVCAQALYRGQAAACSDPETVVLLNEAAAEEVDHLAWCNQRLKELQSRPSLLNPVWYAGSFALGLLAGRAGVARSLGFMAETERQVEAHLEDHLHKLPEQDRRSRSIVEQMKTDEMHHRVTAQQHGAQELPAPIKGLMTGMSKVMTKTAYRI
jgi:ubiquinone biosynthesis monooxygenase Coq7